MKKNNTNTEPLYNPLTRFQPTLVGIGMVLAHGMVAFLISTNLVQETWWQFASSILLCIALFGGTTWLFYQGKDSWPSWDKEFVHIPLVVMTIITVYWIYILPEIREGILLTWLGFYPCVHGRVMLSHFMIYSSNLMFIYLYLCYPTWSTDQALFTSNFAFAMSSLVLSFYLGLTSYQERIRDQKYIASEKRLAAARQQLKHISEHDALTDLLNRRGLENHLHQRYENITMLAIDIDHFKPYNDHYGHPQGDACLRQVAQALQQCVGDLGYVARYGGEEFVALLYDFNPNEVVAIADQCCQAVRIENIPHEYSNVAPVVTISLGGWYSTEQQLSLEALWQLADKVLYKSKETGRNRFNIDGNFHGLPAKQSAPELVAGALY